MIMWAMRVIGSAPLLLLAWFGFGYDFASWQLWAVLVTGAWWAAMGQAVERQVEQQRRVRA